MDIGGIKINGMMYADARDVLLLAHQCKTIEEFRIAIQKLIDNPMSGEGWWL